MLSELKGKNKMKPEPIWVKCKGEAHSNPYIDNCGVCMPYWETYPICPKCRYKLTGTGKCTGCGKFYNIKQDIETKIKKMMGV
jgi:hypothetical protein